MNNENRRKLVREILDSDKNINIRVSNIQRQKLLGVVEDVNPYIQINQEDINKMKIYASTLRHVLEKRYLLTNNFLGDDTLPNVNKYIVELAQTEDVIASYNNVVSVYLNPRNTQETKTYIRRMLVTFEDMVRNISINVFEIIGRIKISRKQEHINLMIYALTLYKIILEQMNTGVFHIITITDMKHNFSINLQQYDADKLEVAPVRREFVMSEDGGDTETSSNSDGEPLPPLEDPNDLRGMPENYTPPEFFARAPYENGPSERDIEDSRARVSRLGKPSERGPVGDPVGDPAGNPVVEPDGEPGEDIPSHDEPISSGDFVYTTPSKKLTIEVALEAIDAYNKEHPERVVDVRSIDDLKAEMLRYEPVSDANKEAFEREAKELYFVELQGVMVFYNIVVRHGKKEPAAEEQADKIQFVVQNEDIIKSGAYTGYIEMAVLFQAIDTYNNDKPGDAPVISIGKTKSLARQYELLTPYINFVYEDGTEYTPPVRGSGRRKPIDKVEIIPSTEPAMQFNDVKNDPYFVIQ